MFLLLRGTGRLWENWLVAVGQTVSLLNQISSFSNGANSATSVVPISPPFALKVVPEFTFCAFSTKFWLLNK